MKTLLITWLAAVCKQYGPGRLPYADRRDVGGGYATATTAAVATVTFILVMQVPGLPEFLPTGDDAVFFGTVALPIVVPSAFVSGALAWRAAPTESSQTGPMAGLVATCLTYVVGGLVVAVVLLVESILENFSLRTLSTGVEFLAAGAEFLASFTYFVFLFIIFAFAFTFWATLPLGALGGFIYEHTRTA